MIGFSKWARLVTLAVVPIATCLTAPMSASAEALKLTGSSKSRAMLFKSQAHLLDGKLAKQYQNSIKLTPKYDPKSKTSNPVAVVYNGSYKGTYLEVAKAAARKHGIPEDMFLRLVQQESGWKPGAVSSKGATGLAQLMPETAAHLGVDPNDPVQNLDGGARYLRMMYDQFGDWRLAVAAYNAGPQAVTKHGGIPPYTETKNYVVAILD